MDQKDGGTKEVRYRTWLILAACLAVLAVAMAIISQSSIQLPLRKLLGSAMDSQSKAETDPCNNQGNPYHFLPPECYADPSSFVTTEVDGMRFRIPAVYFGPYLRRSVTEKKDNKAPHLSFPFWMPDGRSSSRDMGSLTIVEWRKPEEGWPPLRDDQHIVMVRTLQPLRPGDGNLTPYKSLKQMRAQFSADWPRQEDEFGLAKFMHLAAPEDFEYATTEDDDRQVRFWCRRNIKFPHGLFDCQGSFYSRPDQLLFNIQFLAEYLKDWQAITEQALKLVRAWKADGER